MACSPACSKGSVAWKIRCPSGSLMGFVQCDCVVVMVLLVLDVRGVVDARRLDDDLATDVALVQRAQVPAIAPEHVLGLLTGAVATVQPIAGLECQLGWPYFAVLAGDRSPACRLLLEMVEVVGLRPPLLVVSQPVSG